MVDYLEITDLNDILKLSKVSWAKLREWVQIGAYGTQFGHMELNLVSSTESGSLRLNGASEAQKGLWAPLGHGQSQSWPNHGLYSPSSQSGPLGPK